MSASAGQVTKMVVANKDMYVDGVPVATKSIKSALGELFSWLRQFRNVVLTAYNGRRFDFPIIMKACRANGMASEFMLVF